MKSFNNTGMSIIELMVVLMVMAILGAVAVPSFKNSMDKTNVEKLQSDFANAITTARAEAASRQAATTICASQNGELCTDDAWSSGWIVFVDNGQGGGNAEDGARNGSEELLLASENQSDFVITLQDDSLADIQSFSFNELGFSLNESRALVTICEPSIESSQFRGIVIERSGRPSKTKDVDEDGVHESRFDDGFGSVTSNALTCPT